MKPYHLDADGLKPYHSDVRELKPDHLGSNQLKSGQYPFLRCKMIVVGTSNLIHQPVDALVNTVNCVGVMGKGVALQFKMYFPDNYEAYRVACLHGGMKPGKMFLFKPSDGPWIINFPTKLHWKDPSKMSYIEEGLIDLLQVIQSMKFSSLAIPALGCGNGGLDWKIVRPKIVQAFESVPDVQVMLYDPQR